MKGNTRKINLLLVDDHELIREGLKNLLDRAADMELVADTGNPEDVIHLIQAIPELDVILMDLSFPNHDGIEVIRIVRQQFPVHPRILVLSVHSEAQFADQSLRAGAQGYVRKDCPIDELFVAIRKVHSGFIYISGGTDRKARLSFPKDDQPDAKLERLSARETQVLTLLASGKTTQQISEALNVSPNTVKTYRSRILEKMGFRTKADLIRYALYNGLVA
jgi:DNA-binding NarL/FixJ family response regulator